MRMKNLYPHYTIFVFFQCLINEESILTPPFYVKTWTNSGKTMEK